MANLSHISEISLREADVCFALADPKRVDIVHTLEKRSYTVNELTLELGIPQPMTSRHLKVLRERGLVQSTRHGVSVTYALSDPRVLQALELLNEIQRGCVAPTIETEPL
jgi:DNA-binding transcriptional ArsR family regulator